jgi:hypothetical protein
LKLKEEKLCSFILASEKCLDIKGYWWQISFYWSGLAKTEDSRLSDLFLDVVRNVRVLFLRKQVRKNFIEAFNLQSREVFGTLHGGRK